MPETVVYNMDKQPYDHNDVQTNYILFIDPNREQSDEIVDIVELLDPNYFVELSSNNVNNTESNEKDVEASSVNSDHSNSNDESYEIVINSDSNALSKKIKLNNKIKQITNSKKDQDKIEKAKLKHSFRDITCKKSCRQQCRHCELSNNHRKVIWTDFWSLTYTERRKFLAKYIVIRPVKRRTTIGSEDNFVKNASRSYYLPGLYNNQIQVCKSTFLNTFGYSNDSILTELCKYLQGDYPCQSSVKENRGIRNRSKINLEKITASDINTEKIENYDTIMRSNSNLPPTKKRKLSNPKKFEVNFNYDSSKIQNAKFKYSFRDLTCKESCRQQCGHDELSKNHRQVIWSDFWSLTLNKKRQFLAKCIVLKPVEHFITVGLENNFVNNVSHLYYLPGHYNNQIQVCKSTFLNTLGFPKDMEPNELCKYVHGDSSCLLTVKKNQGIQSHSKIDLNTTIASNDKDINNRIIINSVSNIQPKKKKFINKDNQKTNLKKHQSKIEQAKLKHSFRDITCKKSCRQQCHHSELSQDHRQVIWTDFWLMTYSERRKFLARCIVIKPVKRRTTVGLKENFIRNVSRLYYLPGLYNNQIQVCKSTFLNTFGYSNDSVLTELCKYLQGNNPCQSSVKENRGIHSRSKIDKEIIINHIRMHKEFHQKDNASSMLCLPRELTVKAMYTDFCFKHGKYCSQELYRSVLKRLSVSKKKNFFS